MTEMQPTEIELTGKKKRPVSLSRRKIVLIAITIAVILLAVILTAVLANRASRSPESIQTQALPSEGTELK